jgi:hypothetical protein
MGSGSKKKKTVSDPQHCCLHRVKCLNTCRLTVIYVTRNQIIIQRISPVTNSLYDGIETSTGTGYIFKRNLIVVFGSRSALLSEVQTSRSSQLPAAKSLLVLGKSSTTSAFSVRSVEKSRSDVKTTIINQRKSDSLKCLPVPIFFLKMQI